jgi:hypothetical protein
MNLKNDPNELHNLIDDDSYEKTARKLKDKLYEWMSRTNDPILKGRIKDLRQDPPIRF